MKKLTLILFLIPFALSAQIELSDDYSLTKDKFDHIFTCKAISAGVFTGVYAKTEDAELSFNASWIAAFLASLGKEMGDLAAAENFSLSDFLYGTGSGVVTAGIIYGAVKLVEHRKEKKRMKKFWKEKKLNGWALNNKFLNN